MPSVLIVCGIRLFREGLAELLGGRESLQVVGAASDFDQALRFAHELAPEVILLDQALPKSLELSLALRDSQPHARVIALGILDGAESTILYVEAGVAGYVPRDGTLDDVVGAIEGAVRGELHCSPWLAGTIARRLAWQATAGRDATYPERVTLTAREAEIIPLLTQGRSNKEIAATLGIEVTTVKNHVHNVLEKLQVHRRAEIAARMSHQPLRRPPYHLP